MDLLDSLQTFYWIMNHAELDTGKDMQNLTYRKSFLREYWPESAASFGEYSLPPLNRAVTACKRFGVSCYGKARPRQSEEATYEAKNYTAFITYQLSLLNISCGTCFRTNVEMAFRGWLTLVEPVPECFNKPQMLPNSKKKISSFFSMKKDAANSEKLGWFRALVNHAVNLVMSHVHPPYGWSSSSIEGLDFLVYVMPQTQV